MPSLRSCSVGPPPSAIHGRGRLTRHPCRVAHCAGPALGLPTGQIKIKVKIQSKAKQSKAKQSSSQIRLPDPFSPTPHKSCSSWRSLRQLIHDFVWWRNTASQVGYQAGSAAVDLSVSVRAEPTSATTATTDRYTSRILGAQPIAIAGKPAPTVDRVHPRESRRIRISLRNQSPLRQ